MRVVTPILFFVLLGTARSANDPCAVARNHFQAGEFAEGRAVLYEALVESQQHPEALAPVLEALAEFSERYVGDHEEAARQRRRILELGLPSDQPAVVAAREALARSENESARYEDQNRALSSLRAVPSNLDAEEAEARLEQLKELCRTGSDYPNLAAAYYYMGEYHKALERYGAAYRSYRRAIEIRPAIGFYLPAPTRMNQVFAVWMRRIAENTVWGILGAGLVCVAVLFYSTKPWQWLGVRHAILLAGLLLAWKLFFMVVIPLSRGDVHIQSEQFEEPVYMVTQPEDPFSEILSTFFNYGLAGVLGAYVIAVTTARLRPRFTWTFINVFGVFLLLSCVMGVFYFRHGRRFAGPGEQERFSILRGGLCYHDSMEQLPYILIDPTAYPGFQANLNNMDEPVFIDWFKEFGTSGESKNR